VAINVSGGALPAQSYGGLLLGTAGDAALIPGPAPDLTGARLLQLIFQFPLTNAGGTVFLIDPFFPAASSFEGFCVNAACSSYSFDRLMVDGGVVGVPANVVPVPAAAWLLGSGLVGLGWLRRAARTTRASPRQVLPAG
jgi:hypothetical protein